MHSQLKQETEMKKNIRKEYFKRLRTTLKSKLNAKHVSQAINTWVVPTARYSGGIIERTKEDVKEQKKERLSPYMVGYIRDQTLSSCTKTRRR